MSLNMSPRKLTLILQGSVFVEFAYEKEMTAFLEADEPKKYTEESTEELIKMTKFVIRSLHFVRTPLTQTETHTSR